MAKAAYPTIGIAALVMFGIVYFIGCLHFNSNVTMERAIITINESGRVISQAVMFGCLRWNWWICSG